MLSKYRDLTFLPSSNLLLPIVRPKQKPVILIWTYARKKSIQTNKNLGIYL